MPPSSPYPTQQKTTRWPAVLILLAFTMACSLRPSFLSNSSPVPTPTATPTFTATPPKLVQVDITVVYPSPTVTSTPTQTPTPPPTPIPTDTPLPTETPTETPVPPPPTAIPLPTGTPAPPTETPVYLGEILLESPQHELLMPVTVTDFEFKWRWTGREDCTLPPDYAFELRIWPPGGSPLAAMNALAERDKVYCDPVGRVYSYRVGNIKDTAGPMSVAVQTAATGPFLWDVALLQTYPALQPVLTASPRSFVIPGDYVGPYDTTRPTVTCLAFAKWLDAQALYLATGGPQSDLNGLDPDGNGIACDEIRN